MGDNILDEVYAVVCDRKVNPKVGSYVNSLLSDPTGLDRILEKIGEEAAEVIIAAKNGKEREIVSESADLLFHLMIMLAAKDIPLDKVREEFARRRK
jgi:phosphoribosyl-ATP pyrophosphohydrolase